MAGKRHCTHASCDLACHQPSDWLNPTTYETLYHRVNQLLRRHFFLLRNLLTTLLIVYNFRVSLATSSANGENERKNLPRESSTRTQSKETIPRFVLSFVVHDRIVWKSGKSVSFIESSGNLSKLCIILAIM